MSSIYYDQVGVPSAYSDDGVHIFLFNGAPVAYIEGDSIYAFYGTHLGWLIGGWIVDHEGDHVFFTEVAGPGPVKPLKELAPLKELKELFPLKDVKELKPLQPVIGLDWSPLTLEAFFRLD